ncbi:hypothetical protein CBM2598_U10194 [Cupriavidus taiwanensis]|uniref:Uncharacterized protein n=1 Tax=Cupriavidus taiwanensis TaxID=164546 RepID=A0A7Z7JHU8_9BURK|nr:hypothetical protein CBM2597_U10157 [Cupriavidus taiwanensis]SOZ96390.1 hypothetical protein CBM2598_U10194 [Cupriavidus taiwanensis]SPC25663.1 hypothetical protein CBM2594_U10164 [Cupriavidus taiwanensis]
MALAERALLFSAVSVSDSTPDQSKGGGGNRAGDVARRDPCINVVGVGAASNWATCKLRPTPRLSIFRLLLAKLL